MKAFHSSEEVKKKYLDRVRAHHKYDQIIKGTYWKNGKGCAVGCTIHGSNHSAYEDELGIPSVLARLEDGIFEGLPNDLAVTWPDRFLDSITPGADLSHVWPKFAVWMLINKKWGVIQFVKNKKTRRAIFAIANAYELQLEGSIISANEWIALRKDAYAAAAAYAAADAADAAAAYAAYAAAAAAAYAAYAAAAADAAADAAAAYAAAAARNKWRIAQSEKLLKLLKEAK